MYEFLGQHGLLGESKTFVGVLLSILVICIICRSQIPGRKQNDKNEEKDDDRTEGGEETNPLQMLLNFSIIIPLDRLKESLGKLKKPITNKFKNFESSNLSFCAITKLLQLELTEVRDLKYQRKAATLNARILSKANESMVTSGEQIQNLERRVSHIPRQRLSILSAFYCLLYGLALFIIDEIIMIFDWQTIPLLNFLIILTLLSTLFLLVVWICFLYGHSIFDALRENEGNEDEKIKRKKCTRYWIFGAGLTLIFIVSLFLANIVHDALWERLLVYILGMCLPWVVIIILMIRKLRQKEDYSHKNIAMHFISLSCLSLIYTLGIFLFMHFHATDSLYVGEFNETNLRWVRFGVEMFIFTFGIVFSFFIPYLTAKFFNLQINSYVALKNLKLTVEYQYYKYKVTVFYSLLPLSLKKRLVTELKR